MLIGEFKREQEGEGMIIFNSWIMDSKRLSLSVKSLVKRSNGREICGKWKYDMLCAIPQDHVEALTPK